MVRLIVAALLVLGAASCRGRSVSYPDPVYDDAGNARSDAGDGGDVDAAIVVTDVREDNAAALVDGRCVSGAFKRDGVCRCQAFASEICGDFCTDLSNDDANCGACGHACGPTSPCVAGVCRPAPETIVAAAPGCVALDLDARGDVLHWSDAGHGTIMRLSPGGPPTIVALGEKAPRMITARGITSFWIGGDGQQIRRVVLGQGPTTVATSTNAIHGLVVSDDASTVYYSTGTDIMRVAADGGSSTVVVRDPRAQTGALALDGDRLGFLEAESDYVWVAKLLEGHIAICGEVVNDQIVNVSCNNVARGAPKFKEQIAMPPGQVVWAFFESAMSGPSYPAELPDFQRIGGVLSAITGLAATPTSAYFSEGGFAPGEGIVYAAPLARDSDQVRLARAQNAPRAITVGTDRVYWSTGDCTIMGTKR